MHCSCSCSLGESKEYFGHMEACKYIQYCTLKTLRSVIIIVFLQRSFVLEAKDDNFFLELPTPFWGDAWRWTFLGKWSVTLYRTFFAYLMLHLSAPHWNYGSRHTMQCTVDWYVRALGSHFTQSKTFFFVARVRCAVMISTLGEKNEGLRRERPALCMYTEEGDQGCLKQPTFWHKWAWVQALEDFRQQEAATTKNLLPGKIRASSPELFMGYVRKSTAERERDE